MADNKKPIDKEYLIDSLKDFDEEILSKKYADINNGNQGTSGGVKDIDEVITKLNEKDYLKGLATESKVADEIENHAEAMKDLIRNGYQKILDEDIAYFTGVVAMHDAIPSDKKLTFTNAVQVSNNKINIDSDGYLPLKAGHTYFIHPNIMISKINSDYEYHITDKQGNLIEKHIGHYAETGGYSDSIYPIIYEPKEDCAICIEIGNSLLPNIFQYSITIYEIKQPVYTNVDVSSFIEKIGDTSEDTPVGHIIPYMGINPPAHYLICDGSEYNIDDYKDLANHFISEFGTVNHFGGDGVTTFAVPDLRGEFLRGSGTATRDTGSGADVSEHQDPTSILNVSQGADGSFVGGTQNTTLTSCNADMAVRSDLARYYGYLSSKMTNSASIWCGKNTLITTRPTNTSVMWCIKAEHTFFVKFEDAKLYSEQEKIIGRWTDGKILYQKVIKIPTDATWSKAGTYDVSINTDDLDFGYIDTGLIRTNNQKSYKNTFTLPYNIYSAYLDLLNKTIKINITGNFDIGDSNMQFEFIINYTKK